jgi:hypothetical protein
MPAVCKSQSCAPPLPLADESRASNLLPRNNKPSSSETAELVSKINKRRRTKCEAISFAEGEDDCAPDPQKIQGGISPKADSSKACAASSRDETTSWEVDDYDSCPNDEDEDDFEEEEDEDAYGEDYYPPSARKKETPPLNKKLKTSAEDISKFSWI